MRPLPKRAFCDPVFEVAGKVSSGEDSYKTWGWTWFYDGYKWDTI